MVGAASSADGAKTMHADRGQLLYRQSRYAAAEREFRAALLECPGNAEARAYLALCLFQQDSIDEARAEASASLAMHPDSFVAHMAVSTIEFGQCRYDRAIAAARESLRIFPYQEWAFGQIAACYLNLKQWPEALEAAESGLSINPTDADCLRMRSVALQELGRPSEAKSIVLHALAEHPEDGELWTWRGWQQLRSSQHGQAREAFLEALRLDPHNKDARQGFLTTLHSRNLVFRLILPALIRLGSLSLRQRATVVAGWVVFSYALQTLPSLIPSVEPLVGPIMLLALGFAALLWIAEPVLNLILRFDRAGRRALDRDAIAESNWVGAFLALSLVGWLSWPLTNSGSSIAVATMSLIMVLPTRTVFRVHRGPRRQLAAMVATYIGFLAVCGTVAYCAVHPAEKGSDEVLLEAGGFLMMAAAYAASLLFIWFPLVLRNPERNRP